jgi:hypothetical protein
VFAAEAAISKTLFAGASDSDKTKRTRKRMKASGVFASLVLLQQCISAIPAHAADAKATTLLLQALAAKGGEAKLRVKSVEWRQPAIVKNSSNQNALKGRT